MNYFTKEQLEDITNSILSNPTTQTLKDLYDKYSDNKEEVVNTEEVKPEVDVSVPEPTKELENTINIPVFGGNNQSVEAPAPVVSPLPNSLETPVAAPIPGSVSESVVSPLPNVPVVENVPIAPTPSVLNTETPTPAPATLNIPSFVMPEEQVVQNNNEMPQMNAEPLNVNTNQNPVPFGGNLWETPTNSVNNLMQTTDNFNTVEEKPAPVEQLEQVNVPFFGGPQEAVNNPIPVMEKPQSIGPTMFGQFEQSYRG